MAKTVPKNEVRVGMSLNLMLRSEAFSAPTAGKANWLGINIDRAKSNSNMRGPDPREAAGRENEEREISTCRRRDLSGRMTA